MARKPTVLHRLHGTYNVTDHRSRDLEPIPEGELKTTPAGLTPEQRSAWRYVMANAPRHVLKRIDRDMLLLWVQTKVRHDEAQRLLDVEQNAERWAKSALHRTINNTTALLVRLGGELGFSPASRPRLQVIPQPIDAAEDDDPWGELRLLPGGRE